MSEQRIQKLENDYSSVLVTLGKLETTLDNINNNIVSFANTKEDVITFREKFKITEKRLNSLESGSDIINQAISSINLKIALVTGAWSVIFFLLNRFIK